MKHSIKTRTIVLVLIVVAAGIAVLTAQTSRLLRQEITEHMGRQQYATASYLADTLQHELQNRLDALDSIAQTLTPEALRDADLAQRMIVSGVLRHELFNGGILVIRPDGTAIADSQPGVGRVGTNYRDIDTVAKALNAAQGNVGAPVIGKKLRQPVIGLTVPILDPQGGVIGALSGIINLGESNFFEALTNQANAQPPGYLLLVAPQQRLVITSSDSRRIMDPLPPRGIIPSIDRFIDGAEGWDRVVNPNGDEVLAGVKRIPLTGWYVAMLLPTAEAFAPIAAVERRLWLGAGLLMLSLTGLLLWLFNRQFVRLHAAVNQLKSMKMKGCVDTPLPLVRTDEVDELIVGFNDLLTTIGEQREALRHSERKFVQIFGKSAIPTALLSLPEGSFIDVNDAFLTLFDIDRARVLGATALSLGIQRDLQGRQELLARLQQQGSIRNIEQRLHTCNGELRTVLTHADVLQIDHQSCALVSLVDITDRLLAEDRVRQILPALDQNPNAIMITDRLATLVYVNTAFETATGYTQDEAIGRNPRFLQSGQTPAASYRHMWQSLIAGQPWRGEFYNRRKNGEIYVEYCHVAPILDAQGNTTHYISLTEDITEKKRLSAELDRHRHHLEQLVFERTMALDEANQALAHHAEAATSASVAKSAFLASMSHEIRTPMNAIIGFTHLAEQRAVDERQREYLVKTGIAAQHLLQVINDILDLSKIEAGKLQLTTSEFSMASLFDSTLTMIRERAESKGLQLASDIDPVLDGRLLGDGVRFGQILLNFATNAVKFTEVGQIHFSAHCLQEDEAGVLVRCAVQDTGIGIAPEAMARLFQPFEQANADISGRYGGTGLGLAINRRLAVLMGGECGAESTTDRGSTFWFTARVQRGCSNTAHASAHTDAEAVIATLTERYAKLPVLIVEDEPINREISQEILSTVFQRIDLAEDGLQAVAMAARENYGLILMDMQMPGLDGPAATGRIRQLPRHRQTPIIAMTANAFAEDKARCLSAGMNDFISKPVFPEHLFAIILAALDKLDADNAGLQES